jgi:N-methylhydantoinase B
VRVRREHVHVPRARRQISLRGERFYTQPWGLYGGLAGAAATASIERADGARVPIPSKLVFTLNPGDRLHISTAGGGGYGDPLERPPQSVLRDVLDRKVSPRIAHDTYGVVLACDDSNVDVDATAALRKSMRDRAPPASDVFDHGTAGRSAMGLSKVLPLDAASPSAAG